MAVGDTAERGRWKGDGEGALAHALQTHKGGRLRMQAGEPACTTGDLPGSKGCGPGAGDVPPAVVAASSRPASPQAQRPGPAAALRAAQR